MGGETVGVRLTESEKRRFRMEAARRDVSMSELGGELLSEWLEEHADEQLVE